jgi:hypothetical protein
MIIGCEFFSMARCLSDIFHLLSRHMRPDFKGGSIVTSQLHRIVFTLVTLLVISFLSSPELLYGQPGIDKVDLGQKEKIAVKRAVDQIVVKLRHYYAMGDYDKVLEECDNLEKIEPKNAIGSYYRSLATKRKEEKAIEREIGPSPELGTTPVVTSGLATPSPVTPTMTPAISSAETRKESAPRASAFANRIKEIVGSAKSLGPYGLGILVAAAVLIVVVLAARKVFAKRPKLARGPTESQAAETARPQAPTPAEAPGGLTSLTTDISPFGDSLSGSSLDMAVPMTETTSEEAVGEPAAAPTAGAGFAAEGIVAPTPRIPEETVSEEKLAHEQVPAGESPEASAEPVSLMGLESLYSERLEEAVDKMDESESKLAGLGASLSGSDADTPARGLYVEPESHAEKEEPALASAAEADLDTGTGDIGFAQEKVEQPSFSSLDNELFGEPTKKQQQKPEPPRDDVSKLKKTAFDEDFEKLMFEGESEDETIVSKKVMEEETLVAPIAPGASEKGKVIKLDISPDQTEIVSPTFDTTPDTIFSDDTVMLEPAEVERPAPEQEEEPERLRPEEPLKPERESVAEPISAHGSAEDHSAEFEELGIGGAERKETLGLGALGRAAKSGTIEERNEALFRDQYNKGCQAFAEGNWKMAVHYFTVASALKPDMQEVKERLRIAKAERKRTENE